MMAGESCELLTMRVGVAEVFCESIRKGAVLGLVSGDDYLSVIKGLDFGAFGTITTFLAIYCFLSVGGGPPPGHYKQVFISSKTFISNSSAIWNNSTTRRPLALHSPSI